MKKFPTTFSKDRTWGQYVRRVTKLKLDGDWRGVLGTLSVVKDTRGAVWDEDLGTDMRFNDDTYFILEDFDVEFTEQMSWYVGLKCAKRHLYCLPIDN